MKLFCKICAVYFILYSIASVSCFAASATDTVPPSSPSGLCVTYRTCTSLSLSWSGSQDETGVKGYQVFRDGRRIVTVSRTAYINTSLVPGYSYTYSVKAYDAAGNLSESSIPIKVSTLSDLQAPSIPRVLSVADTGYTYISLKWEAATDNTGIKTYEIYRNNEKVASTVNTTYTCKSLKPGEKCIFTVRAIDIAGNCSAWSSSVTAATTVDNAAPSVPEDVRAVNTTETEISLYWNASSDNVKVRGYEISCEGSKASRSSDETYTFRNLIPGKAYTFSIKAFDASGNLSASSKRLTITTITDKSAPSAPANFILKSAKNTSVALSWDASTDNVKVQGYHVYCNGIRTATTARKSCTVKKTKGAGIYIYTVRAYDLSGNLSSNSKPLTVISLP